MSYFIKIFRMKFYLFYELTQDIEALMNEGEDLLDPLFLMAIMKKDKAEG